MAKKRSSNRRLTRKQVARHEREQRAQRLLTLGAAIVGIAIVAILAYGVVSEVFIKARRPVAKVGEVGITSKAFKARQSYERWLTELQIYQYQSYIDQVNAAATPTPTPDPNATSAVTPTTSSSTSLLQQLQAQVASLQNQLSPDMASVYAGGVLDSMIEEELVRQEAAARGITATDAEIHDRIGQIIGYVPETGSSEPITPTATVTGTVATTPTTTTPTPTPLVGQQQSFDDLYQLFKTNVLDATGFPEQDFTAMVTASVLSDHLKTALAAEVPQVQDQVQAILFSVDTEEAAKAIQDRLNQGQVTADDLIAEFNDDGSDATQAYSLPWLPVGYLAGQLGPDVEKAAFNTPVGKASEPVAGLSTGYVVVYVVGHEERALSSDLATQADDQAYQDWLTTAKDSQVEYLDWEDAVITQ